MLTHLGQGVGMPTQAVRERGEAGSEAGGHLGGSGRRWGWAVAVMVEGRAWCGGMTGVPPESLRRLTLQNPQAGIDTQPLGSAVLSATHSGLVGPGAEPHVGPDGSCTLPRVQQTDDQGGTEPHGLGVVPEHAQLHLQGHGGQGQRTAVSPRAAGGLPVLSSPPCPPSSPCPSPSSPLRSASHSPSPPLPALAFLLDPGAAGTRADLGPPLPRTWYSAVCGGSWSGLERRPLTHPQDRAPGGGRRLAAEVQGVSRGEGPRTCTPPGRAWGALTQLPRRRCALRSSPDKLLLDLIQDWFIVHQVCVAAERVFNQQHLLIVGLLQGCCWAGGRRQRPASSLEAPIPTSSMR